MEKSESGKMETSAVCEFFSLSSELEPIPETSSDEDDVAEEGNKTNVSKP